MQSLSDESIQHAVEAASIDGTPASLVPSCPPESGVVGRNVDFIDDGQSPPVFGSLWREFVSVFTLAFAPGLNSMSVGSVNIALPSIGRSLGIDNSNLTWVVAAYSVANGCFLLTAGRLADLYGRRRVFLLGSLLYLICSILCGFSQNGIMLFISRAVQGIASAISVPGAVGIVGATYHRYNKRKAMAFAIIGGMATTGFLAGILLGGICAQLLTWRWLFFITAIIDGVMLLSVLFIVPKMAGEDGGKVEIRQKYKEIDWWGQLLSISGLVLLSFSLTYSSEAPHGWGTWYIISLLVLSVVLLGLFIWIEHRRGVRAMMPLKIWKYPQFGLLMALLFFGWFDFEIVTLYMTFLFQNVRGVPPLQCTLYFLPDVIFGMLTALVMARLIPRCRIQFLFFAGALFLLCAPLLMVFSPADQSYWPQSFPAVALSAIGGMTLFNVSNVFVSSAVAREDQALGQGIFNTVVQIGTAISLALAATVAHAGGVTADASRMELLHGYRNCFWLCVGILVIPLVGVWFLKGKKASESGSGDSNEKIKDNSGNNEDDVKIEKAYI